MTVSDGIEQVSRNLKLLYSTSNLQQKGIIQPCGGNTDLLAENANTIRETEFELSDGVIERLGLDLFERKQTKKEDDLRTPSVRLCDIILPADVQEKVELALHHDSNSGQLMNTWGLGEVFKYGTGVTMLFYGPPGTGKTATAEAIAHELNKPLLVADYSKIQNCYVGQTEKNIMSTFRKARKHKAVLFWDEADAMFFDRDNASRNWEVRDVNVLLQEIERFEGICILATNRKLTLDKALERRITAKIEFPRPNRELRENIWRKMLPEKLPLASDIDFADLGSYDLSGGEIKNIVLNAARFACARGLESKVEMNDFKYALEMEKKERWTVNKSERQIGFRVSQG